MGKGYIAGNACNDSLPATQAVSHFNDDDHVSLQAFSSRLLMWWAHRLQEQCGRKSVALPTFEQTYLKCY